MAAPLGSITAFMLFAFVAFPGLCDATLMPTSRRAAKASSTDEGAWPWSGRRRVSALLPSRTSNSTTLSRAETAAAATAPEGEANAVGANLMIDKPLPPQARRQEPEAAAASLAPPGAGAREVDKALLEGWDLAHDAARQLPGDFSDWVSWSELLYVPNHNFVVCAIPKVASTMWKQMVLRITGIRHWNTQNKTLIHNPVESQLRLLGVRQGENPQTATHVKRNELRRVFLDERVFKVAFVRDPVTRLLSSYLDRCVDLEEWERCLSKGPIKFSEVVAAYEKRPVQPDGTDSQVDVHFRNQTSFCGLRHMSFSKYSVIAKYENMVASSRAVLRHLNLWNKFGASGWGVDGTAPFAVEEQRTSNHVQEHDTERLVCDYYTPELLQRVHRLYQNDFKMFGYSIDIWMDKCGWTKWGAHGAAK